MKVLLIVLTLCSISWCDKSLLGEKFLSKIGQYEFQNENNHSVVKSYYVSRDSIATWLDAFQTCKVFGMDLVELPTAAEADYFLTLCDQQHVRLKSENYHLGATYVGAGNNEFYWMTTEKHINYAVKWGPGKPDNPGLEKCFSVYSVSKGTYKYNDVGCVTTRWNFFCQHITNSNQFDSKLTKTIPSTVTQCKPATIEWFPHPTSCNKYIICFHGTAIEKTCAPNLRFSAKEGNCILSKLPCCPQDDDVMNPVFLANINDCSKYYVCFSGKAIERSCAKGLFFDVTSNSCTLPENFCCGSRPIIDPEIEELVTIDTSICKWYGNVTRESGSYIKSLCYYDKQAKYEEASDMCNDHGMRLMRIEDNSVQAAIFAYLLDMFGKGNSAVYHISGRSVDGSWYHDENTLVSNYLQWKGEKRPESGCLALCAYPFSIDAFSCSKSLPSICEFIHSN